MNLRKLDNFYNNYYENNNINNDNNLVVSNETLDEKNQSIINSSNNIINVNPTKNMSFLDYLDFHRQNNIEIITAFSQDQDHKVYVTHKILENAEKIWEIIRQVSYL